MAVPTKEQFKEYLSLIDDLYIEELEDKLLYLPALYPDVSDAISEINARRNKAFNTLSKSPVYLWLNKQHSYILAMRSLSRRVKFVNPDVTLERDIKEVIEKITWREGVDNQGYRRYFRTRQYSVEELARPMIEALLVYFYGGSIEDIIQYQKNEKLLLLKAKNIVDELSKHFDSPLRLEVEHSQRAKTAFSTLTDKKLKMFNRNIDMSIYRCNLKAKPIKRNDAASRERLLVFNLYMGFKQKTSFGRASKATAITHLLNLEGIESYIGQRSVERLIQKWKAESKELHLNRP